MLDLLRHRHDTNRPIAIADNFATIVVTRFFDGGASSVAIDLVGGHADIHLERRGGA